MKIITLTQKEYNDALKFVKQEATIDHFDNFIHYIGEGANRRRLHFARMSKSGWELVTPFLISTGCD